jgi:hypothetical protein
MHKNCAPSWLVTRKSKIRAEYEYVGDKKKMNDNVEKKGDNGCNQMKPEGLRI